VFVLNVFVTFVCVCVKWFCETCVFVLNVFVRFVCVCV